MSSIMGTNPFADVSTAISAPSIGDESVGGIHIESFQSGLNLNES